MLIYISIRRDTTKHARLTISLSNNIQKQFQLQQLPQQNRDLKHLRMNNKLM